ncbi:MAG TPA: sigma-70 family RNA polymerase sigma factor [Planctomycetota bacterium]|nr:sigma-70 family RNA polymerase sigma factor [Planctomycetota bacterium]
MDARLPFDAPERLLAESEWLARLARSLTARADDAADLAQDTLVAALQHPPDPDRPLRPWLARIAHNLAIRRGTSAARREARESFVARREALPSTSEVVERVAMQRTVVEAVLSLDEPYRSTLLLRYWDDLAPRRIAARMGVPVETVRTRLKRGLAMLRERLDRCHGDRETWMSALLPIAHGAVGAGASVAGGVFAMNSLTKVAVGVVLAIAAVWGVREFAASPGTIANPRGDSEQRGQETAAIIDSEKAPAAQVGENRDREVAASIATPEAAARNEVRCTVIDDVTGNALVGAHATLYVLEAGVSARKQRATAESVAGGLVALEDLRADRRTNAEVEVWADGRAVQWVNVPWQEDPATAPRVIELGEVRLPQGSAVRGMVVATDGATPIVGARLFLTGVTPSSIGIGLAHWLDVGVSDSAGRFQLERRLAPSDYVPRLFALTKEGMGWATVGIVEKRATVDDVVVRMRPSAQLEVEVVDSSGVAIEGVTLYVSPKFEPLGWPSDPNDIWLGDDPWVKESFSARTNAEGLASFSRLPVDDDPGHSETGLKYKLTAYAKGKRTSSRQLQLDWKQPTRLELALETFVKVELSGRVSTMDGAAIAGASLREARQGAGSATTDALGQYRMPLSAGPIDLEVEAGGFASKLVERPRSADETAPVLDVTLARETPLEGRVIDDAGKPLAGFTFHAQRLGASMHWSKATDEDGHFMLGGLDEGFWAISVSWPDDGNTWDGPSQFTARGADSPLILRMRKLELGHGRIEVALHDAITKKPLTPISAYISRLSDQPMANGRGLDVVRELGIMRAEGLSAGNWRLSVTTSEGARGEREIVVAPTDLDLRIQWELASPGRIVGRVDFDGVPVEERPRDGFLINNPYDEGQWVPGEGQAKQSVTRGFAPLTAANGWAFQYEDVAALQPVVLELSAGPYIARSEVIVPVSGEASVVLRPQLAGVLRFARDGEREVEHFELALRCEGDRALRLSTHYQSSDDEGVLRDVTVPAGKLHWRIRYWAPQSGESGGIRTLEGDAAVRGGETTRVGVRF